MLTTKIMKLENSPPPPPPHNFPGGGGRGKRYYFKTEGPKILAPFRLTAQKSCPLQKFVPQKL